MSKINYTRMVRALDHLTPEQLAQLQIEISIRTGETFVTPDGYLDVRSVQYALEKSREFTKIALQEISNEALRKLTNYLMRFSILQQVIARIDELAQTHAATNKTVFRARLEVLVVNLSIAAREYQNAAAVIGEYVDEELSAWRYTVSRFQDEIDLCLRGKADGSNISAIYADLPANADFAPILAEILKRKERGRDEHVLEIGNAVKELLEANSALTVNEAVRRVFNQYSGYELSTIKNYYYRVR